MRPKFTKGPWKIELVKTSCGSCFKIGDFPSQGVRETTSACIYADTFNINDFGKCAVASELQANAQLISAAPDLYEACIEAQEIIQNATGKKCFTIEKALKKVEGL